MNDSVASIRRGTKCVSRYCGRIRIGLERDFDRLGGGMGVVGGSRGKAAISFRTPLTAAVNPRPRRLLVGMIQPYTARGFIRVISVWDSFHAQRSDSVFGSEKSSMSRRAGQ